MYKKIMRPMIPNQNQPTILSRISSWVISRFMRTNAPQTARPQTTRPQTTLPQTTLPQTTRPQTTPLITTFPSTFAQITRPAHSQSSQTASDQQDSISIIMRNE